MRKLLIILFAAMGVAACSGSSASGGHEAPELLHAVPSDAIAVGTFSRCDKALESMLDSTSALRSFDYGKLSHSRAAIALCDVGKVVPLLVLETGRAAADTSSHAASVISLADSLDLHPAYITLGRHNALLLSPSLTVVEVALRHIGSGTSVLDAPDFDSVLTAVGNSDAVVWRNRGASKLFSGSVPGIPRARLIPFLRDASEWTAVCGDGIHFIQPASGKYYCNFIDGLPEGSSKFARECPEGAQLIVDYPLASVSEWREAHEKWLDARVELDKYRDRHKALAKRAGKSPAEWEKAVGVREAVCIAGEGWTVNMVRAAKSVRQDGVQPNEYAGFVRALYGEPFSATDSCVLRRGSWIISGERSVLDTLRFGSARLAGWPSSARVVVSTPQLRITCTKDNNIIWHSNR